MGLAVALVAGLLAILRPWTIVPIQSATAGTFDAGSYVSSIWESRVLPVAEASAIELKTFMEARQAPPAAGGNSSPRAVFVKGRAVVTEVDRRSRVGLARLRLSWSKNTQAAAVQIGPVFRGTALRDALDFVRFTDFVNQLEFAGVANALNDRVAERVLAGVEVDALAGRDLSFIGAVPIAGSSATLEIVPVHLQVVEGAQ
jgi:predicted lipoprotein